MGKHLADDAFGGIVRLAHGVRNPPRRILNVVTPEQRFEADLAAIHVA